MRVTLVTGTDTGVGKTVATAVLACSLRASGRRVTAVKPAQTGVEPDEPGDAAEVRRLAGIPVREGVRLRHPLAPTTAARLEGVALPDLCAQRDLALAPLVAGEADHVLVEGAGGVRVPLGPAFTLLDLGEMCAAAGAVVDAVVVARAGLGTLNHAALTVDAVQARGLAVQGVLIGAWPAAPGLAEEQNLTDLPDLTGVPVLGRVPDGAGAMPVEEFRRQAASWLAAPLP